jgi:nitrate reductase NapE component
MATSAPTETVKFEPTDYPALFQAANRASVKAQNSYFAVLALEMWMLISGAVFGAFGGLDWAVSPSLTFGQLALVGSIATLLLGLCVALISRQRRHEQQWFNCRAISETVKSLSWRYMTRAPPLQQGSLKEADKAFGAAIADILQDWKDRVSLAAEDVGAPQRTAKMRAIRESPFEARLEAYRAGRMNDQQRWYSLRAREHDRSESRWFAGASLAQLGAVVAAVLTLKWPGFFNVRPVGAVATVASAAFAWLKAKRFRELSSAYSLAAQELSIAEGQAEHISTDEELAKMVQEVEERISREHTTWRARSG